MKELAIVEGNEMSVDPEADTCPVKMEGGTRCGRQVHRLKSAEDKTPVCLMHSRDPNKSEAEFQREFEGILKTARKGTADFTEFVFRSAWYAKRVFEAHCIFRGAIFNCWAVFNKARFAQKADFERAEFMEMASFVEAKFDELAEFSAAKFCQDAGFIHATFGFFAVFNWTKFVGEANFSEAAFKGEADFGRAEFGGPALFREAGFDQKVSFQGASLELSGGFNSARFLGDADFTGTKFAQEAYFNWTRFAQRANFRWATFKDRVEFLSTVFRKDASKNVGPVLSLAKFEKPESVFFYDTYLGQALLHNCDVSRLAFTTVRWGTRNKGRKRMIFEEEVDPALQFASDLKPGDGSRDDRNYELVAVTYQQLKKNYDDRRDYWTAGDWHYGEMEMKRLSSPRRNRFLRWWHRNLGLVALYRLASEYGESYTRPLALLAAAVLLFALLIYPIVGLSYSGAHSQGPGPVLKWSEPCPDKASYHTCMGVWRLAGNSLLTSVEVAAFQRELSYEPVYPWGRLARLVELVLTSTLLALFLLALRRQFRR